MSTSPAPQPSPIVTRTLSGRIIEALTIDFWATIAKDVRVKERRLYRRDLIRGWLHEHGVEMTADEVGEMLKRHGQRWLDAWLKRQFTPGAREAVDWIVEDSGIAASVESRKKLAQKIDDSLHGYPPEPVEGALDAIRRLSEVYPLALVCDTGLSGGPNVERILTRWGIRDCFTALVFSDAVGVSKPHPKMFLTAITALDVPQQRVVHIGDRDDTDILGSKSFGMAAIRFDGGRHFISTMAGEGPAPASATGLGELCGPKCSMADRIVTTWDEILDLLLVDGKE